jgi:hypothetical protein
MFFMADNRRELTMRKRFEIQYELGVCPVEKVKISLKSRDELPPTLRALQHIYVTPSVNEKVFDLLEEQILTAENKNSGRIGMSLWEILVLGTVRLCLGINYDRLEHIANYDKLVRDLLGVSTFGDRIKRYPIQTIKDNVSLLDEATLDKINELVVKEGHRIKKNDRLEVKIDSYVLESTIHFPTDINLLWDSCRKCIELVSDILSATLVSGWRKHQDWFDRIKSAFIRTNKVAFGGGLGHGERVLEAAEEYLNISRCLSKKIELSQVDINKAACGSSRKRLKLSDLSYFKAMLDKHINLVERRLIYGEQIPHAEKVFSLFEPYTEWIKKGKAGNKVELGLRIALGTDQYGFILGHQVMEKQQDVEIAVSFSGKLLERNNIDSISFDKGFWSNNNHDKLKDKVSNLVMPKRGKLDKTENEREHSKKFLALRKQHSVIESDINSLEHHGLNRCPDKGLDHFKTYVSLGILSFNLHRLGNILPEEDRKEHERQQKYRKCKAA